jgi:hypothetical protein
MFTHVVLFWLKPLAPPETKPQMIDDCASLLAKIPGVRTITTGVPAMTPRPIVDNSYQVGLCVILDDSAAHDVYQSHPLHKEFLDKFRQHWQDLKVYDFH